MYENKCEVFTLKLHGFKRKHRATNKKKFQEDNFKCSHVLLDTESIPNNIVLT